MADAIHCQEETAQLILDQGGDYLLRLKVNRPALHKMVADYFAVDEVLQTLPSAETSGADHGRLEVRRAFFSQDLSWVCGTKTASTEPALFSLKPILPQPARAGRSSTYSIGASTWSSTRTRKPQPQGQRTGKPCNLAKTRPQLPKKIKNRCLDPSQEKTGRMVQ